MQGFYNKKGAFFIVQSFLLLFLVTLSLYVTGFDRFFQMPRMTIILYSGVLLISLVSMAGGLLLGLGISLTAMFILGSVLIYGVFVSSVEILSVKEIVIWMIAIIASSLISGIFHRWTTTIIDEHKEMAAKFDGLVTIDEVTGFDNKKRFHLEMEEEFKRSLRTGTPFTLLLIQFKYFQEYERLYGFTEFKHLVKSLSDVLWKQTRISDRKFRVEHDTFGVILFNTGEENLHYVLDKIGEQLKYHKLADGKKEVTITVSFGAASFKREFNDYAELIQHAFQELEEYMQ
ncbi:GGDEF domain-containing protein [Paenibacillus sedimenti]|uniref:GGDEF domain-containing protein n=1 Tax=Paenibacillus sedimenti TaxID=2770274 RepID=A0A926KTX6_9BACL|nr:GGDEF domain-containing protein [Paenibacillus sedimenti]MBD0383238.1 GGDEF domain-containing protein [Paenibacillus sedimenti]